MKRRPSHFFYVCTGCGAEYNPDVVLYVCPDCSQNNSPGQPLQGVLKVVYDYRAIAAGMAKGGTAVSAFAALRLKRFLPLLPLQSLTSLPPLRIGDTPLYRLQRLGDQDIPFSLWLKDDSQNPTFSFKDRASAVVSAYAREHCLDTIVAASTGNAGSSIAGICAAQGQKAVVMVPETAPQAKLTQIVMYGAEVVRVKGTYDDAFDMSIAATLEHGWYNRNTAYNPITIEGKKSVSFELFAQMGQQVPERIFVPTGDGVILAGVYKGFEDLMQLGVIDRMPVVVAVQAAGSDNLVRNLDTPAFVAKKSKTVADSISVDVPRNFLMARQYLHAYDGEAITVSDEEILTASARLARTTGIFAEPAAAAAFAGMLRYHEHDRLTDGSDVVVLLTGSGLKDVDAVKNY